MGKSEEVKERVDVRIVMHKQTHAKFIGEVK